MQKPSASSSPHRHDGPCPAIPDLHQQPGAREARAAGSPRRSAITNVSVPGSGLLHPLPLLAIAVLCLNDHVFKAHFGSVWTGKLSDFAGLAYFPLFLQALWELWAARRGRYVGPSLSELVGRVAATGIVFSLTKSTELGAAAYGWGLVLLQWPLVLLYGAVKGSDLSLRPVALTRDLTDLVALCALGVPLWCGRRRVRWQVGKEP